MTFISTPSGARTRKPGTASRLTMENRPRPTAPALRSHLASVPGCPGPRARSGHVGAAWRPRRPPPRDTGQDQPQVGARVHGCPPAQKCRPLAGARLDTPPGDVIRDPSQRGGSVAHRARPRRWRRKGHMRGQPPVYRHFSGVGVGGLPVDVIDACVTSVCIRGRVLRCRGP